MVPQSGGAVVGVKRIMISLPESLLKEVDGLASLEKGTVVNLYGGYEALYSRAKKTGMREQMKKGTRKWPA